MEILRTILPHAACLRVTLFTRDETLGAPSAQTMLLIGRATRTIEESTE